VDYHFVVRNHQSQSQSSSSRRYQALFDDYTVPPSDLGAYGDPDDPVNVEGIKLALHVAITAGRLELMHVGGVFDR
jgi:hypothetical protein